MLYPEMSKYMSHEAFAAATIAEAKRPVSGRAHAQDHCQSYETIMESDQSRFNPVMSTVQNCLMKENGPAPGSFASSGARMDVDVEAELGRCRIAATKAILPRRPVHHRRPGG